MLISKIGEFLLPKGQNVKSIHSFAPLKIKNDKNDT